MWSRGGRSGWRTARRRFREAATEEKLAAKLEKVTERLPADAPNMERPGADLIAWYLSPDRPGGGPWSRKHADTQRRLCERFIAPVIARHHLPGHQDRRHAAGGQRRAHRGEGARLRRCLSALVTAGITGGYLTNPRLRRCTGSPGRTGPRPARR